MKTYTVQSQIGHVTGTISISALDGHIPGIILTRNNVHRVVLLNEEQPKTLPNSIPAPSSLLTMEFYQDTLMLYTTVVGSTVNINIFSCAKSIF